MGVVISLEERRREQKAQPPRKDLSPEFAEAWEAIFDALELVETLPKAARARELLLRGLDGMLKLEKRRLGL